jgi:nucleoside-diphosphate-sugar epimerase
MKKLKVLVCGATGFIGRNVALSLVKRDDVEVIGTYFQSEPFDNDQINFVKVDLRDSKLVDDLIKDVDIVIQAAATTSGAEDIVNRPYLHVTDNAVMNSLILRSCYDHGVKQFIFFSCTVMYPNSETPLLETDFDANEEIFPSYFGVGWTKVYVEKMCEFYGRLGRTKHTVIRHSNVYGPYDKYDLKRSHVFGATVTKVMSAEDGGKMEIWGTGEEERDLIHISDLVNFIDLSLNKEPQNCGIYNVGDGTSVAIRDLVAKVITASGKQLETTHNLAKPTIKTTLSLDCSLAKETYGWEPKISLEDGIADTISWWSENPPDLS